MTAAGLRRVLWTAALAVTIASAAGCGAVRIETGATPEEKKATATGRAREVRSSFAAGFDRLDELGRADMLKTHIDSSSSRLVNMGRHFASEWRRGNDGRGSVIPADEMRRVFENSTAADQPIFKAWEDNMEYGWSYIQDSSRFDDRAVGLFGDLVDQYYGVYSAVMYPTGTAGDYESAIDRAEADIRANSRDLTAELQKYR